MLFAILDLSLFTEKRSANSQQNDHHLFPPKSDHSQNHFGKKNVAFLFAELREREWNNASLSVF